ncbi:MAG: sigma-54 dependent transcriptional regulator [Pseudomonadota bacterium]
MSARLQLDGIIGRSDAIRRVYAVIERIAPTDSTIMITGETGTGKGIIAKAIHQNSNRRDKPFVAINCGAIPENLLESELFGHVKGAFTGAVNAKTGKFELAAGGTIFLDEIGDMSPDLQVKILRVLEENQFERVGGNKTITVDIRVIAATHRNLKQRVAQGLFREDLFYRLYVIPLALPPLRERIPDIPVLADFFREEVSRRNGVHVEGFSVDVLAALKHHPWPGNIRELKNLVERLVVIRQIGTIDMGDLPEAIRGAAPLPVEQPPEISLTDDGISLNSAVTEYEKALILQSLEKTKWVKNKAAKLLQLNRTTLVEKIKRYQLEPTDMAAEA